MSDVASAGTLASVNRHRRWNRAANMLVVVPCCLGLGWVVSWVGSFARDGGELLLVTTGVASLIAALAAVSRGHLVGIAIGAFLVSEHMIGWTAADPGAMLYALRLLQSALLIAFAFFVRSKSLGNVRDRRFALWFGVMPWIPSILGALVGGNLAVALGRTLAFVVATAIFIATSRVNAYRLAWGLLAGVHLALLPIVVCAVHSPDTTDLGSRIYLTQDVAARFGGGACAYVHPNVLGLLVWPAFVVWLALPWTRATIAGLASTTTFLLLSDSRASIAAALVGTVGVLLARGVGRGSRAQRVVAGVMVALAASLALWSISDAYFLRTRAGGSTFLTGRETIWQTAIDDFKGGSPIEKLLGTSEGGVDANVIVPKAEFAGVTNLSTHNGYIGLLRRSGLVGFFLGLLGIAGALRLVGRTIGKRESVVATALVLGALATTPAEAWLFGTTLLAWMMVAASVYAQRVANGSTNARHGEW